MKQWYERTYASFNTASNRLFANMSEVNRAERIHNLDVTVWVGKHGLESVRDELDSQLDDRGMVKVKFHRSARAGTETADLADELAEMVDATVADARGHTAVIARD